MQKSRQQPYPCLPAVEGLGLGSARSGSRLWSSFIEVVCGTPRSTLRVEASAIILVCIEHGIAMTSELWDYVIVGAGSAGCVLANRLTASGNLRVLVLEAGGPDAKLMIRVPAGFTARCSIQASAGATTTRHRPPLRIA